MPSMRLAVTVAILVAGVLGVTLSVPWLKTPVLIALADGLAVTGVIVLIRAGQVSFGHAMYACLAGYGVAFIARALPPRCAAADRAGHGLPPHWPAR